jgi:hypothetical protein
LQRPKKAKEEEEEEEEEEGHMRILQLVETINR